MKNYIKNIMLPQRIEYQWRQIVRLRKKLTNQYERDGDLWSDDFQRLYDRLNRRCARVMILERELNENRKTEYTEVEALLV